MFLQIRDTVERDTPEPQPSAFTRSSTLRVEVPVMYAVMITAHNARSILRRGSSNSGKNEPSRSLGMPTSTSPAGVDTNFGRCPLRCVNRAGVRSPGSAPIVAVSSVSISSCKAAATMSRNDVVSVASEPARRSARSDKADSYMVIVRCSSQVLVASENRTMTTNITGMLIAEIIDPAAHRHHLAGSRWPDVSVSADTIGVCVCVYVCVCRTRRPPLVDWASAMPSTPVVRCAVERERRAWHP